MFWIFDFRFWILDFGICESLAFVFLRVELCDLCGKNFNCKASGKILEAQKLTLRQAQGPVQ